MVDISLFEVGFLYEKNDKEKNTPWTSFILPIQINAREEGH